jgi:hypothetical protein
MAGVFAKKHGRSGKPKDKSIFCAVGTDCSTICWEKPGSGLDAGKARSVAMIDVAQVRLGTHSDPTNSNSSSVTGTKNLRRKSTARDLELSVSLILEDSHKDSLDLTFATQDEVREAFDGFELLLAAVKAR